jgi:autotransporter-associated beta strand protein
VIVGEWDFIPGASKYNFTTSLTLVDFTGAGIINNGGAAGDIIVNIGLGALQFLNNSTAGNATINLGAGAFLAFFDISTAGSANIINSNKIEIDFNSDSSAGSASIVTNGLTQFFDHSTAGSAAITNNAGGTVDFSRAIGPAGDHKLTVGSIAGAGTYDLGADQLTVGLNGFSREVSGPIDDGGIGGGSGASLVKVGQGKLTLSDAGNTYSGGTILEAGKLDIAAVGAAGPRAITFAGRATLAIENAALAAHVFGNDINSFARHDFLDLAGLKFHAGATATYHTATDRLVVHSGHVAADTLTLVSPHGHHFGTASDGHGGTDVFLLHA